jgi:two-component sensor histidine kinase
VLIGLRSALVVLAPLLAIVATALVVWLALEVWVLHWFHRLQARVEMGDVDHDTELLGAPPELRALGAAFDRTLGEARERAHALELAAESNRGLSRDLHHRVKNNLQILVSLLSRQQKRSGDAVTRHAVAQSRCRVLAIALIHRFLDAPEHLGVIDLDAYLAELGRQAHAALFTDGRRARLLMEFDPSVSTVANAQTAGILLVETLGAGAAAKVNDATVRIQWRASGEDGAVLTVEVTADGVPVQGALDSELMLLLARQSEADARIGPGARVTARFRTPALGDEAQKAAS